MSKTIKIAVLTDLHAFNKTTAGAGAAPSWIDLAEDQSDPRQNPFAGLAELKEKFGLAADVILCCGDMGDKASPEGQQYAWREVNKLKDLLGAKIALGTAGNHDLDSRFAFTNYDARGQIQALEPPFPVEDYQQWLEYWAKNFTIVRHENVRFVLLNSAAYHGYAKDPKEPEYNHGRVSDRTLQRLIRDLEADGKAQANILVCHHHPYKNDLIKLEDYSQMENGDKLVNDLTAMRNGPWLVIHGHKHMPRIYYAPGSNSAPTIFSAGSFSAKLYAEYMDHARNEFYILELQIPTNSGSTTSLKGTVSTWQWSYGNGWIVPKAGIGLGPVAAFGTRADTGELADEIAQTLKATHAGKSVSWQEILTMKPPVRFLIPEDLSHFLDLLENGHGLTTVANRRTNEVVEVQVP